MKQPRVEDPSSSLSSPQSVGLAVGISLAVDALILLLVLAYYYFRKRRNAPPAAEKPKDEKSVDDAKTAAADATAAVNLSEI